MSITIHEVNGFSEYATKEEITDCLISKSEPTDSSQKVTLTYRIPPTSRSLGVELQAYGHVDFSITVANMPTQLYQASKAHLIIDVPNPAAYPELTIEAWHADKDVLSRAHLSVYALNTYATC